MPTALIVADHSEFTRIVRGGDADSGYFRIVGELPDESAGRAALAQGDVAVRAEHSRRTSRSGCCAASVRRCCSRPTRPIRPPPAPRSRPRTQLVDSVARKDLDGPARARSRGTPPPFDVRVHRLYNPESVTQYNIVPGLMGVILTMTLVMMTGLAITRERERGTMENLLAMPVTPARGDDRQDRAVHRDRPHPGDDHPARRALRLRRAVRGQRHRALRRVAAVHRVPTSRSASRCRRSRATSCRRCSSRSSISCRTSCCRASCSRSAACRSGRSGSAACCRSLTSIALVRGILLKGNDWPDLWPSLWPLIVFALVVMTIAVRFYRRTLD